MKSQKQLGFKLTAIKSISFLWVGSLLSAGLAFLTQVLLARTLSVDGFGVYSSSLAFLALLAPLIGFGIAPFWLKSFGGEGWKAIEWIKPSFLFLYSSSVLVVLCIYLWAAVGPHNTDSKYVLYIMAAHVLCQNIVELIGCKFQLEERYVELSVWQFLPHFLRFTALVLCLVFLDFNIFWVACSYLVVSGLIIFLGARSLTDLYKGHIALKGHGERALNIDKRALRMVDVVNGAWPFGLAAIAHLIYFQSDIVLISYFKGNQDAGIYNAAFTVITAVYLLPAVLYQKYLLPKLHRWSNSDREIFIEVFKKGTMLMLVFGCIAALTIWISADYFVPLIFGDNYITASSVLKIIGLSVPAIFVALSVGASLVTQEHMRRKVKYMLAVACVNILLNVYAIPVYGVIGAAWATVISNYLLLTLYSYGAARFVFKYKVKIYA